MKSIIRPLFITACVIFSNTLFAQDERFLRQLFTGGVQEADDKERKAKVHYRVHSPFYEFDIDGDLRNEKFLIEKRDSQTWLHIHNYKREIIFSYKFETKGLRSDLYKIQVRNLSKNSRIFMLYYYEGKTEYVDFFGTSRVYFLTVDNSDLKTLAMKKGPAIWEEAEVGRLHYRQRSYDVSLFDYNKDGVNEVTIKYHLSSKVYFYKGMGKWLRN
jgi:hypothetical protein